MVTKIDHIGIAVKNLEETLKFYEDVLGMKSVGTEVVEEQKVKVAFLPIGDTEVELLESTEEDGPIAKFIEKKGEGIQHIAYRVDNIEKAIEELKAKGIKMIDEKPRYGAGGAKIAFLHPKSTFGVLFIILSNTYIDIGYPIKEKKIKNALVKNKSLNIIIFCSSSESLPQFQHLLHSSYYYKAHLLNSSHKSMPSQSCMFDYLYTVSAYVPIPKAALFVYYLH